MENLEKNYFIKIPKNTSVIYNKKEKIISILGLFITKSLKLNADLKIMPEKKLIKVKTLTKSNLSSNMKKKELALKKATIVSIKQLMLETNSVLYQKLKLVGVGFKVFAVEGFENQLLSLKLGHSHPLYFKIPSNIFCFSKKRILLFFYGNYFLPITNIASFIRSHKKPEPYKGKGILYDNEKITLKEGKKV